MLNNEFFTIHVKVVNSMNFGWIELITVAEVWRKIKERKTHSKTIREISIHILKNTHAHT